MGKTSQGSYSADPYFPGQPKPCVILGKETAPLVDAAPFHKECCNGNCDNFEDKEESQGGGVTRGFKYHLTHWAGVLTDYVNGHPNANGLAAETLRDIQRTLACSASQCRKILGTNAPASGSDENALLELATGFSGSGDCGGWSSG